MATDVNQMLKDVASKGKILLGEKQTKQAISQKTAKLVVIANNCPYNAEITKLAGDEKIPVYQFQSDNIELGHTCGKSYGVSTLAVIDAGESSIMHLVSKKRK